MPQPFGGAQVGDRVERVDGAGVGGAGARHDRERRQAGGAIGGDRRPQVVHRQPVLRVARQAAHAVGHDAGELRRLQHRVMRLVGGVEHAAPDVGAEVALAGAQDAR